MKNKTILITGCASLFGKYLSYSLAHYNLIGTFHTMPPQLSNKKMRTLYLDILDKNAVKSVVTTFKPSIVIHLAALSNIDFCEKQPHHAYRVNVEGTKVMCEVLQKKKIHFIFASSNAIFDGKKPPYKEIDTPNSLNVYGKTKIAAETIVNTSGLFTTIMRCTSLFGWPPRGARDNDVTYYLKQLTSVPKLYLVKDKYFNPTSAMFAALAVKKIITKNVSGIYHVGGKESINRYEFVQKLVKAFKLKRAAKLIKVTSDFFPTLAKRPDDATLDISKMVRELQISPKSLLEELRDVREESYTQNYV